MAQRPHFAKILAMVKEEIPEGVHVVVEYMCKVKLHYAYYRRYEQMEDSPCKQIMLENFDRDLAHSGREDLEQLKKAALAAG